MAAKKFVPLLPYLLDGVLILLPAFAVAKNSTVAAGLVVLVASAMAGGVSMYQNPGLMDRLGAIAVCTIVSPIALNHQFGVNELTSEFSSGAMLADLIVVSGFYLAATFLLAHYVGPRTDSRRPA